jgi:hypothetical protein
MPYKSDRQRRFMHAQHPEIAARWDEEIREGGKRRRKRVSKSLAELGEISKRSGDKGWLESQRDYYKEGFSTKPFPGTTYTQKPGGIPTVDRMTYIKPGKSKEFKGWLKESGQTKRARRSMAGDIVSPVSLATTGVGSTIGASLARRRGGPALTKQGALIGGIGGTIAGIVADTGRTQGKVRLHRQRLLDEAKGKGYLATGKRKGGQDVLGTIKHNAFTSSYNAFPVARRGHPLNDY